MAKTEIELLKERIEKLEKLENGSQKVVKDKKPRKPSAYNDFMKKYISDEKKKDASKTHQELFAAGAKAWGLQKEKA
jgi:FMN phosphatase YigB (HAD superfamily)